jgi:hypothetical protein
LLQYGGFFSLFELKCREKNVDSAPSPRQQVNPQFYTVRKLQTTDEHNGNGPGCQIEPFSHLKYQCKIRRKMGKKGGWVGYLPGRGITCVRRVFSEKTFYMCDDAIFLLFLSPSVYWVVECAGENQAISPSRVIHFESAAMVLRLEHFKIRRPEH